MGLVAIQTPQDTQARVDNDQAQRIANKESTYQQTGIADALAAKVRSDWEIAKQVKTPITRRLVDCLERRQGAYSSDKMAQIKATKGSMIYMQLTGAKCRAGKAYLSDLYNPSGDRPFAIKPTPIPDLPPEIRRKLMFEAMSVIQQAGMPPENAQAIIAKHQDRLLSEVNNEAENRAEKMADQIEDMLIDANWRTEFDAFLDDIVTYPAAIIKGPVFSQRKKIKWKEIPGQGFAPQREAVVIPEVRRVSPFDEYPSPGVRGSFEGHWNCEHRRFTFSELSAARGAPGYNTEAITQCLVQYRSGGLSEWLWTEEEHRRLSGSNSIYGRRETIDAIEWTGTLSGQMLVDWGMDRGAVPDMVEEYPVSVIVIGNYAIRALINPDPAGKSDYYKACWENVPGSFWGRGLPEIMADCQDMCNGTARALANNLGIASGPQVWVDTSRLADGADAENIYPWKVWYFKNGLAGGPNQRDPIGFWQPQSNAEQLLTVYERFARYADEITGMPAFAYGSDQGAGAAKTATGLSMLLNASSKVIKSVVHNIDIYVIEPVVEKFYNHVMMFHPDHSIKGDATARARGSEALIHKEAAQARAQELLQVLANPIDAQIIGQDGRLELLKEVLNAGDMPVERILPTLEQLAARNAAAAEQATAQPQGDKANAA